MTIADYVGGSGRDLMLTVALSYTVQSRFVDHANFMTRGFDHTTQLAFSLHAGAARLLGMSELQIARHGSGQRCLVRRRAGKAPVAMERPRRRNRRLRR
jgi:2-methylcitrate dehydratase MmgE/PrpD-like protein